MNPSACHEDGRDWSNDRSEFLEGHLITAQMGTDVRLVRSDDVAGFVVKFTQVPAVQALTRAWYAVPADSENPRDGREPIAAVRRVGAVAPVAIASQYCLFSFTATDTVVESKVVPVAHEMPVLVEASGAPVGRPSVPAAYIAM